MGLGNRARENISVSLGKTSGKVWNGQMHSFILNSIKYTGINVRRQDNLLPFKSILFQLSTLLGSAAFQRKSDTAAAE